MSSHGKKQPRSGKARKALRAIAACITLAAITVGVFVLFPQEEVMATTDEVAELAAEEVFFEPYQLTRARPVSTVQETVVITKQYTNIHYENEEIPCHTEYVDSAYLPLGQEMTISAGQNAVFSVEVADVQTPEGTSRIELEREQVSYAEDAVVLRGTGESRMSSYSTGFSISSFDESTGAMTVNVDGQSLQVLGAINCNATAYCACSICCGPYASGRTATGTVARYGTIAVDPSIIPYGTRLYIVAADGSFTYGYACAEDCGGAINGCRVDLFFETHSQALGFGRRNCIAYILA